MTRKIIQKARELRERQTKAESLLWSVLRGKQLGGLKFRRQYPVPPFVADFACVPKALIVEIDGGYHEYTTETSIANSFWRSAVGRSSVMRTRMCWRMSKLWRLESRSC